MGPPASVAERLRGRFQSLLVPSRQRRNAVALLFSGLEIAGRSRSAIRPGCFGCQPSCSRGFLTRGLVVDRGEVGEHSKWTAASSAVLLTPAA